MYGLLPNERDIIVCQARITCDQEGPTNGTAAIRIINSKVLKT